MNIWKQTNEVFDCKVISGSKRRREVITTGRITYPGGHQVFQNNLKVTRHIHKKDGKWWGQHPLHSLIPDLGLWLVQFKEEKDDNN